MHYSIVIKAHIVLSYSCFNAFLIFLNFLWSNVTDETCSNNNGGCAHICTSKTNGDIQCSCRAGYGLDSNGENCSGENIFWLFHWLKKKFSSKLAIVCFVTDVWAGAIQYSLSHIDTSCVAIEHHCILWCILNKSDIFTHAAVYYTLIYHMLKILCQNLSWLEQVAQFWKKLIHHHMDTDTVKATIVLALQRPLQSSLLMFTR